MQAKRFILPLAGLAFVTMALQSADSAKPAVPPKPKLALSIQPQHVADALRAVILSSREVYHEVITVHTNVPAPPGRAGAASPSDKPLPAPCEVLRLGSHAVANKGVEYSYVLRSLAPINSRNLPETDVETKGLQFVATRPDLSYSAEELLGGRWYFTAVYPDVAVQESCAACHNQLQPGRTPPFKRGDVIGALVVRIALEL